MTERVEHGRRPCWWRTCVRWKPIVALAVGLVAPACEATSIVTYEAASADRSAVRLPLDVRDRVIPPEYFGLSLVSPWAERTVWPAVPVGLYRLINATPRWHELHTGRNRWADDPAKGTGLSRIDAVLHFRDIHSPETPAMFTLGGGDEQVRGGFPPWLEPGDTLEQWRRYVRLVGERYRGRIRYWEVWNEPDFPLFYSGTTEQLVELTRIAAEELRAIDRNNVIIAPSFTEHGLRPMKAFLAAGGGKHVDVIAWHQDNAAVPETDTVKIQAVRRVMQDRGVSHLPLWTTEGHARLERGGDPAAIVARTYLVLWAYGVRSFSWYAWDIHDYGKLDPGPWVTLVERDRPDVPTAAGIAYGEVLRWMRGARMRSLDIEGDVWSIALTLADGHNAWVVWRTGAARTRYVLPAGVTMLRTLGGITQTLTSPEYMPTRRPVLLY